MPLESIVTNIPDTDLIKRWGVADNKKVNVFSKNGEIYFTVTQQGKNITIPRFNIDGIPTKSPVNITTWKAFLAETWVRLSPLGDNEYKLYIHPKLKGGANITRDPSHLWPGGIVPYKVGMDMRREDRQIILAAIDEWNKAKTGFQFVPYEGQKDYLNFGGG